MSLWRWAWLMAVLGCGRTAISVPPNAELSDAGQSDRGPCATTIGQLSAITSGFPLSPDAVVGYAPWHHVRRVRTARYALDTWGTWDQDTWTFRNFLPAGSLPNPTVLALEPSQNRLVRQRGLEHVSSSLSSAYPGGPFFKVIRGTADEASGTAFYEVLAASDAGHFVHGGTLLEPSGFTRMCARFSAWDGGSEWGPLAEEAELVILEYGPDGGSVPRHTGILAPTCTELIALDGGFLAYTVENKGDWKSPDGGELFVSPSLRTRMVELRSNYELVDGGLSRLDAGYCVIERRNPLGGWCDSVTHDEVLRFDSWRGSPTSAFQHDAGVTVIADLDGHLLVGINEQHLGDGYRRYDIGWLREGHFDLIRESQVVPIGYGPWRANSAAFTFARPNLEKWDIVEVPYVCP